LNLGLAKGIDGKGVSPPERPGLVFRILLGEGYVDQRTAASLAGLPEVFVGPNRPHLGSRRDRSPRGLLPLQRLWARVDETESATRTRTRHLKRSGTP
jgi:hypothetical protein